LKPKRRPDETTVEAIVEAAGLSAPSFVIIDGAAGLEKALGLVWPDALIQRCTVHKHRNLLAHAPERLHEEISADYNDMIYASTPKESHSSANGD
jgi:putative transposase